MIALFNRMPTCGDCQALLYNHRSVGYESLNRRGLQPKPAFVEEAVPPLDRRVSAKSIPQASSLDRFLCGVYRTPRPYLGIISPPLYGNNPFNTKATPTYPYLPPRTQQGYSS